MVIEESATLKTGHTRKSKKSTTASKRIRSIQFPMAPPKIRARPQRANPGIWGQSFPSADFVERQARTPRTARTSKLDVMSTKSTVG